MTRTITCVFFSVHRYIRICFVESNKETEKKKTSINSYVENVSYFNNNNGKLCNKGGNAGSFCVSLIDSSFMTQLYMQHDATPWLALSTQTYCNYNTISTNPYRKILYSHQKFNLFQSINLFSSGFYDHLSIYRTT